MAKVYDLVVDYFLSMLPHIEHDGGIRYLDPTRRAMSEFAEKYGVDTSSPRAVTAFYAAVLGRKDPYNV